jgi:hypothetical protein
MDKKLIERLHSYLVNNRPDLLITLQQDGGVTAYLTEKIEGISSLKQQLIDDGRSVYQIEEICIDYLTRNLRPSKFNYISSLLMEEFEATYYAWRETGVLTYEIINLIAAADPLFNHFQFSEDTEDDKWLRYAVIGEIALYLEIPINDRPGWVEVHQ